MTRGQLRALCACLFVLVVLAIAGQYRTANVVDAQQAQPTCTNIIGFSQTMQWYFGGFRANINNSNAWELRWVGGGSITSWADPNYVGWSDESYQVTTCASNSSAPERALLNITGDYNNDPNFWIQQTNAAIANLRRKYPTVRQIILQSVVGGPGGSQCTFNGTTVRASYNFPYINQAISRMAGGSLVAGIAPTVQSCNDYADSIGHLTDAAKGPMGVTIAQYYNGAAPPPPGPTNTPTMTPTPAPTNTNTPTHAPGATSTPTPSPVPTVSAGNSRTVTFDDLASRGPFSGQYPSGVIDWGSNNWFISGPFGSDPTNSIGFNGDRPSATFTFVRPMRLLQVDAVNGGTTSSSVTLSCNGTPATQMTVQPGQIQSIPMGWIGVCNTVTFDSSNGWDTNFDNLVIDNGAPTATPTPTSTSTSTPTAKPTNTPTPQAANTPTATPTSTNQPAQNGVFTINFDDLAGRNQPLNGQYPSGMLDWGRNAWMLSGPYGAFTTNSVGFNGSGPNSATISMVKPMRLLRLDAYNGGTTTSALTLACPGQATVSVALNAHQLKTVTTNWTSTCTSVTVGSTNGWDTNFDNVVVDTGPAQNSGTVTFDDLANPQRTLNGQYPTGLIDWGSNAWYLSGPYGAFRTNSIGFNGGGPTSASFSLLNPKRVSQIDAYNGGASSTTVTISCANQPTVTVNVAARQVVTIATGWTGTCSSVTIGSTNGWDTNFDNLVVQ